MNEYLIIGQAPPAVKQQVPYDTTMLYDMLAWCGISQMDAQSIFEFEAMTDEFPGFGQSGHKAPDKKRMRQYYDACLYFKGVQAKGVIVLGNVAKEALTEFGFQHDNICYIIHPSKRNYTRIIAEKEKITTAINSVLQKGGFK
jgi:hypothetical protein